MDIQLFLPTKSKIKIPCFRKQGKQIDIFFQSCFKTGQTKVWLRLQDYQTVVLVNFLICHEVTDASVFRSNHINHFSLIFLHFVLFINTTKTNFCSVKCQNFRPFICRGLNFSWNQIPNTSIPDLRFSLLERSGNMLQHRF